MSSHETHPGPAQSLRVKIVHRLELIALLLIFIAVTLVMK